MLSKSNRLGLGYLISLSLFLSITALSACNKAEPEKASPPSSKTDASAKPQAEQAGEKTKEGKKDEHGDEGLLKLSAEEIKSAGIKTEKLKLASQVDQLVLTATIRANEDRLAHVAPRVSGRVTKVNANLGDKITQGQSLALLDSVELGEAHSAYLQAQSQFSLSKSDFDRAQKLKADDIISEKDFLRTRSEFEKAKASLRAADDKLRLLDGSHRVDEKGTASVFSLRAPFAGSVIEKKAVLGELAQPDKSLFTIADLSTLWIGANLFEKDLSRIRVGAPAIIAVAAYPGEIFKGKLTYISSTLDKETRAVQARVEVPNIDGRLKPEMFATASIDTTSNSNGLTLPVEAVLLINGQSMAFVAEGGGFEARVVELGDKVSGRVAIRAGIKEGELAVVAGAYALKARMLKSQIGDSH